MLFSRMQSLRCVILTGDLNEDQQNSRNDKRVRTKAGDGVIQDKEIYEHLALMTDRR